MYSIWFIESTQQMRAFIMCSCNLLPITILIFIPVYCNSKFLYYVLFDQLLVYMSFSLKYRFSTVDSHQSYLGRS